MASRLFLLLNLRARVHALFAALLLATAGLQALGPIPAPLERGHGSAFSAATVEEAVIRARPGESLRLAPVPAPLLLPAMPVPVPAPACARAPDLPVRPGSTGPPACAVRALRPPPRAPPCS